MFENLPKSWRRGFNAAAAASEYGGEGRAPGFKMGAALYSGSNLVSVGFNIMGKTHPQGNNSGNSNGIHAELAALIKRRHYSNTNLIMYVYRQTVVGNKDAGKQGCSKPCAPCQERLQFAGVRRVRFINEKGLPEEMRIA